MQENVKDGAQFTWSRVDVAGWVHEVASLFDKDCRFRKKDSFRGHHHAGTKNDGELSTSTESLRAKIPEIEASITEAVALKEQLDAELVKHKATADEGWLRLRSVLSAISDFTSRILCSSSLVLFSCGVSWCSSLRSGMF